MQTAIDGINWYIKYENLIYQLNKNPKTQRLPAIQSENFAVLQDWVLEKMQDAYPETWSSYNNQEIVQNLAGYDTIDSNRINSPIRLFQYMGLEIIFRHIIKRRKVEINLEFLILWEKCFLEL